MSFEEGKEEDDEIFRLLLVPEITFLKEESSLEESSNFKV
jgi:hypothetical protein